jgi:hypothetical protein
MDYGPELLKQGIGGLVAAIFLWLYLAERKENKELYKRIFELTDARRADAQDNYDKATQPLSGISQTLGLIYDKLAVSKKRR